MKRSISLLLTALLLLSMAACITVPGRKSTEAAVVMATQAPTEAPTEAPTPEPTAEPTATPEPTAEPTATPEPLPPENWADIDMDFFREYLSSDITSLHQLVKDPAAFGINYDEVERTLGSYQQDSDREWYAFIEKTLARMDRVDESALSEQEKLAYDTLRQYCELEMEIEVRAEYYGKTWRCFDSCPLEENAHPWEDGETWERVNE